MDNFNKSLDKQPKVSLDHINEAINNMETITHDSQVRLMLKDILEEMSTEEKSERESTVAIRNDDEHDKDKIINIINNDCTDKPLIDQWIFTAWNDKIHTYINFLYAKMKTDFIDHVKKLKDTNQTDNPLFKIATLIKKPNYMGHHVTRKEVRLEIVNVKANIQVKELSDRLKKQAEEMEDVVISSIREGKPHGPEGKKIKTLMFSVNARGFELIFDQLNGGLICIDKSTYTRIKLYPRIVARPWSCRQCHYLGPNHQMCKGKLCANCGNAGHMTRDCKATTRFCPNCRKGGHRSRDTHCPSYMREVIRELKRQDIPLHYFESADLRTKLLRKLSYKA